MSGTVHLQRVARRFALCGANDAPLRTTSWTEVTCNECARRIDFDRTRRQNRVEVTP